VHIIATSCDHNFTVVFLGIEFFHVCEVTRKPVPRCVDVIGQTLALSLMLIPNTFQSYTARYFFGFFRVARLRCVLQNWMFSRKLWIAGSLTGESECAATDKGDGYLDRLHKFTLSHQRVTRLPSLSDWEVGGRGWLDLYSFMSSLVIWQWSLLMFFLIMKGESLLFRIIMITKSGF